MDLMAMLTKVLTKNGLIFAFVLIGITNLVAYKLAGLTKGRIQAGIYSAVCRRRYVGRSDVPRFCDCVDRFRRRPA